jgi:hypothetical protein
MYILETYHIFADKHENARTEVCCCGDLLDCIVERKGFKIISSKNMLSKAVRNAFLNVCLETPSEKMRDVLFCTARLGWKPFPEGQFSSLDCMYFTDMFQINEDCSYLLVC